MNKYIFGSVGVVLFLWIGVIIFTAGVLRIPDFSQYSLDATVEVHGGQRVSQEIYSEYPGLSSIGISVKNENLQNKKDLILTISEGTTLLRTIAINGAYIPDGKFLRYDFPPILDSANKMYTLNFSAPTAVKEDALELYLTKESFAQAGVLQVNQLPYEEYKAVSYVSFHKPISVGTTVSQVLGEFKTRLFKDPFFLVLFSGLIIILLGIGFSKKFNKYFEKLS